MWCSFVEPERALADPIEPGAYRVRVSRGETQPEAAIPWRKVALRIVMLLVSAFALYVLWPGIAAVLGSFDQLQRIAWWWFIVMAALEAASFFCLWVLQRIALDAPLFPVATAQLASNATSRIVPGGAAAAGAVQFRMLTEAGFGGASTASALTATGVLVTGVVAALPILALPFILFGMPVPDGLAEAAWIGLAVFVVMFLIVLALARTSRPLAWFGGVIDRVRKPKVGERPLAVRLVEERDQVLRQLGREWKQSVATSVGKWLFDFLALLAALTAVGAKPNPALVLLAYVAAAVLGMIPITPGGLGFVEAGLSATLALAGVRPGDIAVSVLSYRLVSYWIPLPAGLVGYLAFRIRYRSTTNSVPPPETA